jgi:putative esterase
MTRSLSRLIVTGLLATITGHAQSAPAVRFDIVVPASIHAGRITGRVYVMITRNGEREPRLQLNQADGIPFFGRDVDNLAPGATASIDNTDLGFPVGNLRDIPPGEYFVQAFVNVYSEFRRADGHVVWMHDDQWEGQHWEAAPGNLFSRSQRIRIDPTEGFRIPLVADQKIPPVTIPPDTSYVKRIKFQSPMLTKFWGRPVFLGATILLPRDYERETMSYPVLYQQGHFGLAPPLGFREGSGDTYQEWIKDDFPRMVVVTFQHPNPYYDDSYAVNSVNVGPYGDALLQELIPEVEERFRVMREPYARLLAGGSTGGWEALALQLFHPDFFGGTWCYCPDPVTFAGYEGVDIYKDENAFYKQHEWYRVPTPNMRDTFGEPRNTMQQKNQFELVSGTHGRSGRQLDIWSAVFGPLGKDGYFQPLVDQRTGVIDKAVAKYWDDHYDLLHYMQRNWATLGPKLVDKLRVYVGDMDTYQLDKGVVLMQQWMKTTTAPHYEGFFMYGDRKPHCWSGPVSQTERLKEMAQFIVRKSPEGATTAWWTYRN